MPHQETKCCELVFRARLCKSAEQCTDRLSVLGRARAINPQEVAVELQPRGITAVVRVVVGAQHGVAQGIDGSRRQCCLRGTEEEDTTLSPSPSSAEHFAVVKLCLRIPQQRSTTVSRALSRLLRPRTARVVQVPGIAVPASTPYATLVPMTLHGLFANVTVLSLQVFGMAYTLIPVMSVIGVWCCMKRFRRTREGVPKPEGIAEEGKVKPMTGKLLPPAPAGCVATLIERNGKAKRSEEGVG